MDGNDAHEQPEWNFEMRTQSDKARAASQERPQPDDRPIRFSDGSPDQAAYYRAQERPSIDVGAMAETLRYLYHADEPCDAPNKHRHEWIARGIAGQYPRIAARLSGPVGESQL